MRGNSLSLNSVFCLGFSEGMKCYFHSDLACSLSCCSMPSNEVFKILFLFSTPGQHKHINKKENENGKERKQRFASLFMYFL